jgi:hypothetical protein
VSAAAGFALLLFGTAVDLLVLRAVLRRIRTSRAARRSSARLRERLTAYGYRR